MRVVGDNQQGFQNQNKLVLMLDNQKVGKLEPTLKSMIREINPQVNHDEIVECNSLKGNDIKPRISIKVGGSVANLSVSMGSGNSVYQENIKTFLPYCRETLKMTEEEEFAFLKILYGDVTGRLISCEDAVKYIVNQENSNSALIAIGSLTIQTWNRNLKKIPDKEYKRNSIQVKWGSELYPLSRTF